MSLTFGLIVLLISTLLFALLNSMEIALVGSSRVRARSLAEKGSVAARALVRMQKDQEHFFSAVVVLQNALVFASAFASEALAEGVTEAFWGRVGVTLIGVFFTAFFGELVPKVFAAYLADSWAILTSIPASFLTILLKPIVLFLSFLLGGLSRLIFGRKLEAGSGVTEAELRMLIESSAEEGSVAEEEAELLDRVFHFGDRRLRRDSAGAHHGVDFRRSQQK